MSWEKQSFVIRSKTRTKILKSLTKPMTPTQTGKVAGISLNATSRALRELQKEGLVECLTPNAKTGRIYKITPSGNKIKEKLL